LWSPLAADCDIADAGPRIIGLVIIADGVPVAGPPAADVVDAAADVLVAVLLVPPQAVRVMVRAAASAAAPERANVFI
jgi:hypothetical protein